MTFEDLAAIEADFLKPYSVAVLWTNGGRLYKLSQKYKLPHLVKVFLTDDKKTRQRLNGWAVTRLKENTDYTARLFCEGYRLNPPEVERLINSGVDVIEL